MWDGISCTSQYLKVIVFSIFSKRSVYSKFILSSDGSYLSRCLNMIIMISLVIKACEKLVYQLYFYEFEKKKKNSACLS